MKATSDSKDDLHDEGLPEAGRCDQTAIHDALRDISKNFHSRHPAHGCHVKVLLIKGPANDDDLILKYGLAFIFIGAIFF